ncbi:unnamed protein product [Trichobilharzia regenti]|nr:unnamed protein product [Trichobilharzia regenti]
MIKASAVESTTEAHRFGVGLNFTFIGENGISTTGEDSIDEIDDNEIGALILPDSTKLSIPVEEEYEEDEENNSNNNNNNTNSTDDQSSSSKDVKHSSTDTGGGGSGDSGVGLSRANSDDRYETNKYITPSKVTSSDGTVSVLIGIIFVFDIYLLLYKVC